SGLAELRGCSKDAGGLAPFRALTRACDRADQDQPSAEQRDPPAVADADLPGGRSRLVDQTDEHGERERRQRGDGRKLATRPRERVTADDDPSKNRRGDCCDQEQEAHDRQRVPTGAGGGRASKGVRSLAAAEGRVWVSERVPL